MAGNGIGIGIGFRQGTLLNQFTDYVARVLADSGLIKDRSATSSYMKMAKSNGILDSIRFAWLGEAGGKFRDSGANRFWTKAYSLVTPQARYGPELVVNGGFDTDTNWTKGTGWIISGGKANCSSAVTTEIYQETGYVGKKYTVTYTVSNYVSGNITVAFGYSDSLLTNGNGTYSITGIVTSVNRIGFFNSNGFTGSIDNVSIVEVLNSLDGSPTDATQTTSTSQPYITGNIAPTERIGMKNPNGVSNYMTHPAISFAANEQWSVTTVLNWNGIDGTNSEICGRINESEIQFNGGGGLRVVSVDGVTIFNTTNLLLNFQNKNIIVSVVQDNKNINIYINGTQVQSFTSNGIAFNFNSLLSGRNNTRLSGSIHAHIIRAQALTPTQVLAEANFLRSLYPEIPSVQIGTQTWATSNCEMVATPQGNLIANVTANATWADATNVYNTTYAATAGTDEQKTYAAVKAAAMWRYPNNDSALGAIYNKLYNDYAMKLLAMDIAYYNTANPTAPWGWDIPTEAEWTTLQTTVNNNAEALKKDGTIYWSSPNAGTNSSLFTALPAGYVKEDGTFAGLNNTAIFASKDNMDIPRVGKSIRLIKR